MFSLLRLIRNARTSTFPVISHRGILLIVLAAAAAAVAADAAVAGCRPLDLNAGEEKKPPYRKSFAVVVVRPFLWLPTAISLFLYGPFLT